MTMGYDDIEGVTGPGSGAWNDTDQDNGAPAAGGGGGGPQALPDPAQHQNEYFTIDIEGTRITYLSIPGKYAGEWDWKEVMQSRPPRGAAPRQYDPERTTAAERAEERAARAQQAQSQIELDYAKLGLAVTPEEREQARQDSLKFHQDEMDYKNDLLRVQAEKNKTDAELSRAELEERKALRLSNEAKAKGDLEESKRQFDLAQEWSKKKDELDRRDRELDRQERAVDRALQVARDKVAEGRALGFINGQPTLERQEFERRQQLEEDKFNAELARGPGNFYNNLYRQSGVEPPPRPQAQAAPAAPSTQAQAPEAPKDLLDWRNYSLGDLEKFPDMYLQTLPKEVLESFRNEFLLGRPALMALLSPERIRGEGKWQGTGFAPDMVTKWGKGAPAPAAAAPASASGATATAAPTGTQPPRAGGMGVTGGGGPGKAFTPPQAAAPVATTRPPFGGPGPGSISFPGGLPPGSTGAPGMTAPTEADAIAALEEIRRRRPVGVA